MVQMKKLENIVQTILHLQTQLMIQVNTLNTVFENYILLNKVDLKDEFLNTSNVKFGQSISTLLSNYSIILFNSFLDEYNNHFIPSKCEPEFSTRIKHLRNNNKIILKRINEWNDIKKFRNEIAAHNFRIDSREKKSFFSDEIEELKYKIPNTISEKLLFVELTKKICQNITSEFTELDYDKILKFKMVQKLNIIGKEVNLREELEKIF